MRDRARTELIESLKTAAVDIRSSWKLPVDSTIETKLPRWVFQELSDDDKAQLLDANVTVTVR